LLVISVRIDNLIFQISLGKMGRSWQKHDVVARKMDIIDGSIIGIPKTIKTS
jgi:hypothetical protein